jgi:segregation and condensation protein B
MSDEQQNLAEKQSELETIQPTESDENDLEPENGEENLDSERLRPILECLLFSTIQPLSIKQIAGIVDNADGKSLRKAMIDLQIEYEQSNRGLQIVEVAGGYQMATRAQYAPHILKLNKKRRNPLSLPALETLAIIAYKQPIIRADIEAVRGVDSSGVLQTLADLELIKVVGRKDVIGRPPMYGTTEEFLKVFGLKRISDLPSIKELREQFEKSEESQRNQGKKESEADAE